MTPRDEAILAAIRRAAEAGQPCPSNAELRERFRFAGTQGVTEAVRRLERDGHIVVTRGANNRVVAAADGSWRTAGEVAAVVFASPPVVEPGARMVAWPPEADARLTELWMQDNPRLSAGEIGQRMRLTKNAIIGRVHRLQLPPRGSPIRPPRDDAPAPRVPRAPRVTLPAGPVQQMPARAHLPPREVGQPTAAAPAASPSWATFPALTAAGRLARVTAGTVRYDACRWPQWGLQDRPPPAGTAGMFCGKATDGTGPYCKDCTPRAWSAYHRRAA
jgi:hypothetical protein